MSTYGWETSSSVMRMSTPVSPVASGAAMSSAVRYWLLTEPLSSTCIAHKAAELGGRACEFSAARAATSPPGSGPAVHCVMHRHERQAAPHDWSRAEETCGLHVTGAKASRGEVRPASSSGHRAWQGAATHRARGQPLSQHLDGRAARAEGAAGLDAQLHQAVDEVLDGPLAHARHAVQNKAASPSGGHRCRQGPAQSTALCETAVCHAQWHPLCTSYTGAEHVLSGPVKRVAVCYSHVTCYWAYRHRASCGAAGLCDRSAGRAQTGARAPPHGRARVAQEEVAALCREAPAAAHHSGFLLLPAVVHLYAQRLQGAHHVPDVLAVLRGEEGHECVRSG